MVNEIYRHVVSGDAKKHTPRINEVWKCFQFNPMYGHGLYTHTQLTAICGLARRIYF